MSGQETTVPVVTIDGPGGSGKGTIAMRLAERLGWHFLDSGALYRLVAVAAMDRGIEPKAESELGRLAAGLDVHFGTSEDGMVVLLDGNMVPTGLTTNTGPNGEYEFTGLPPGLYEVDHRLLDNGLRVILKPRSGAHTVALRVVVGIGQHDYDCGWQEIPHFLEHLLFAGTSRHSEAELDELVAPDATNDPDYGKQWHLPKMGAEAAWATADGNGVIVAVLDEGVSGSHPDLKDNVLTKGAVSFAYDSNGNLEPWDPKDQPVPGYPGTYFNHGTHVAGIIAAERNGIGIVGVAPGAKLLGVKVLDGGGFGLTGPVPPDIWILLGVIFGTFSLRFFSATAGGGSTVVSARFFRGGRTGSFLEKRPS